jgi:hypothetical protein
MPCRAPLDASDVPCRRAGTDAGGALGRQALDMPCRCGRTDAGGD